METIMDYARTCRFCGNWRDRNLIRYSTRHYAHPRCFLDHRELNELPYYQIEQMPFRLLKDRELMEEAEQLIKAKHVPKSNREKRLDKIFGRL
jgi:hypothetical protein